MKLNQAVQKMGAQIKNRADQQDPHVIDRFMKFLGYAPIGKRFDDTKSDA